MDTFAKFKEIDYDGDILLYLDETINYFTRNGSNPSDVKAFELDIGKIDTNQDGFISPKEFDEIIEDHLVNSLITNQSEKY